MKKTEEPLNTFRVREMKMGHLVSSNSFFIHSSMYQKQTYCEKQKKRADGVRGSKGNDSTK